MIVEYEGGFGVSGVIFLALALLSAAGFFRFIRHNVLLGLGCALVGAGFLVTPLVLNIGATQTGRPFSVVVVNDHVADSGFLTKDVFNGGHYVSPTGREIPLVRGADWPTSATLIVNDSDRLVTVRRYYYSANPSAAARAPLIHVVFPDQQEVIAGYPYALEDEGTSPPDTIRSTELGEAIDIVYRSLKPYDPTIHGSQMELIEERKKDEIW